MLIRLVERRHTLPILANVSMPDNAGQLEFTTSDRVAAGRIGDPRLDSCALGSYARNLVGHTILGVRCPSTFVQSSPLHF